MNKTIISILLLAVIASAHCEEVQGYDQIMDCINSGSKLVTEVSQYLKNKKWFDGPAVGRIVTASKKTYDECKGAFKTSPKMLQAPVELGYSTTCRNAVNSVKAQIDTLRSNLRWKKFRTFSTNFKSFGAKVRYAKSVC